MGETDNLDESMFIQAQKQSDEKKRCKRKKKVYRMKKRKPRSKITTPSTQVALSSQSKARLLNTINRSLGETTVSHSRNFKPHLPPSHSQQT